jgi:hypothetical protein
MHDEQRKQQGSSSFLAPSPALPPSTVNWRTSNKRPVAEAFGDLGLLEISASGDRGWPQTMGLSLQGNAKLEYGIDVAKQCGKIIDDVFYSVICCFKSFYIPCIK